VAGPRLPVLPPWGAAEGAERPRGGRLRFVGEAVLPQHLRDLQDPRHPHAVVVDHRLPRPGPDEGEEVLDEPLVLRRVRREPRRPAPRRVRGEEGPPHPRGPAPVPFRAPEQLDLHPRRRAPLGRRLRQTVGGLRGNVQAVGPPRRLRCRVCREGRVGVCHVVEGVGVRRHRHPPAFPRRLAGDHPRERPRVVRGHRAGREADVGEVLTRREWVGERGPVEDPPGVPPGRAVRRLQ
jgi:hypothetical protein